MANVTPPGVPADWGNSPIPAGVYGLMVKDTNYLCSKAGHPMILFTFAVIGPEYAGKCIFHYAVMPNNQAYEHYNLMWGKFNAMMESMGLPLGTTFPAPDVYGDKEHPIRVEFFHGKTCRAFVAIDEQEGYEPKNVISNFKKPDSGAPSGVPAGTPTNQVGFPAQSTGMDDVPF